MILLCFVLRHLKVRRCVCPAREYFRDPAAAGTSSEHGSDKPQYGEAHHHELAAFKN
jgi:hypothetical protein